MWSDIMLRDRPFREMMAMRKSLDTFGLEVKEPEHQYEDGSVDYFYHDIMDRIDRAQKSNNPLLMQFTMNGYPHTGTNSEKMKWIIATHKAMDEAEWKSKRYAHLNYGSYPPKNYRGEHR